MRYRRLSYRYTSLTHHAIAWPLALWRREVFGSSFGLQQWRPDADVRESGSKIEIVVDLAGIEEDAIEVQLFDDALVVAGERRLSECDEGVVFHAAGVRQGPFRLELPLPAPVDPEGVDARYERGLLRIALRKAR
ncbi:MAG TPA: Hsp20/alpha crystallin family protein [Myxococcota bacterium]|nr:Hsp20/alpha crystallin family protein [Myxococcota bacterium]